MSQEQVTLRFTGYRLQLQRSSPYEWEKLKRSLAPYLEAWTIALSEPFVLDDCMKGAVPFDLLMQHLAAGELFVCIHNGNLAALVTITNIVHERHADFHAWANPLFRTDFRNRRILSKFAHEIIDYAFAPFGMTIKDGLGLKKLKAQVPIINRPAGRAARALGFIEVGMSPLDALYNGQPFDTILLELLNPVYFGPAKVEILPHAVRRGKQKTTGTADLRATAAVPDGTIHEPGSLRESAGRELDHPRSVLPEPDYDGGSTDGSDASELDAANEQSYVPRRVVPIS